MPAARPSAAAALPNVYRLVLRSWLARPTWTRAPRRRCAVVLPRPALSAISLRRCPLSPACASRRRMGATRSTVLTAVSWVKVFPAQRVARHPLQTGGTWIAWKWNKGHPVFFAKITGGERGDSKADNDARYRSADGHQVSTRGARVRRRLR